MGSKRLSDAPTAGAALKRQRMREQRTIAVEGSRAGGEQARYARAGGSAASGNTGLPPVLEVEKFAQARAFEISAMQRAMKTAKEAGTQRAFQSLPRHLRRRAASHNIRRLPERLRARARGEVPKDAAKPKRVTRSMLGRHRQRPGLKAEMFRKRQMNKMWLETHVWHAKRMHMTEIWGHRLAERPTAKAFRASYRASQHGALVHDASYYQYFELEGPLEDLRVVLDEVCDPAAISPASKRFSTGSREVTVDVFDPEATYPHGRLGPATFIWKPDAASEGPIASTSTSPPPAVRLTVLVRVHPAVARSAALAFEHVILEKRLGLSVALRRFDGEFLTFEITGQRSTEVVKAVLKPTNSTDAETKEAWRKLDSHSGPAGVPAGMIFGFSVYDPRLSFPPRLDKQAPSGSTPLAPASQVAECPSFWDAKFRASIRKPRYRKRDLDARRSDNLVPGTALTPLAQDDRIPVLLSQRTISSASSAREHAISGWTLTVPSGWGMPFWSSLVYSTPRVGGLRERSQQYQEAQALRFPEDAADTPGFVEHETRREADEKSYWERRPPAKRPSYGKLGTVSPWRIGMKAVLGTVSCRDDAAADGEDAKEIRPFVLASGIAERILAQAVEDGGEATSDEKMLDPTSRPRPRLRVDHLEKQLLAEWQHACKDGAKPENLLLAAMVHARITPCTRGVPQDLALIYELELDQAMQVKAKMDASVAGKAVLATGEGEGPEDLCDQPKSEQVIGRVTTGSFSLSSGHGCGIGVVSLYRLLDLATRPPGLQRLVLFRNRDVETFRAATIDLL
ncbi:hypothetical protein JCM10908_006736 [Rhodotorula pacifica]|uniref:ribonuclease P/MRP protein subunit POP1 n=1 Tax=Rhodotorula pacifica TaxID=1495444 RepID=UPI00316FEBB4